MSAKARERGGKNTIARMLGRGCSFSEIDAERAVVEAKDRDAERRKWQATPRKAVR